MLKVQISMHKRVICLPLYYGFIKTFSTMLFASFFCNGRIRNIVFYRVKILYRY